MALAAEAKKVAAEFDYSAEDVNNGVKEFIRQMRKKSTRLRRFGPTDSCKMMACRKTART